MSNIQISLLFLGSFIRNKTGDFLMTWIVSALFLMIPWLLFWIITRDGASSQVVLSEIFKYGAEQIKNGVPFLKAIPVPMMKTLITILLLNVFSFLVVFSFIQGGIVGILTSDNSKSAVTTFFSKSWKNLGRMMGVNLLIAVILLIAIVAGFGLGSLVFVIAGLLIFIVIVVAILYIYIRFAFTPFSVVLMKKSWFAALGNSIDKTKKLTGAVAGIVIVTAILTQILSNLTGNIPVITEFVTSLVLIIQLSLLAPLYKKAGETK